MGNSPPSLAQSLCWALAVLGSALQSTACCGVRGSGEQEARVRQGLSFSLAQTVLENGDPLAGCGTFGSLPAPAVTLGMAPPRGPLGQQLYVELLLGQREPNVPQYSGQWGQPCPSLCSLLILPLWICVLQPCRWHLAGEKYLPKCDYVGVSACASLAAQPCPSRSICRAKMAVGKKISAFWSPM